MEKSLEDILHDFGSRYWMIRGYHKSNKKELDNLFKHTTDELNKLYLVVPKDKDFTNEKEVSISKQTKTNKIP